MSWYPEPDLNSCIAYSIRLECLADEIALLLVQRKRQNWPQTSFTLSFKIPLQRKFPPFFTLNNTQKNLNFCRPNFEPCLWNQSKLFSFLFLNTFRSSTSTAAAAFAIGKSVIGLFCSNDFTCFQQRRPRQIPVMNRRKSKQLGTGRSQWSARQQPCVCWTS